MTTDPAVEADPIFSADGSQVLYNSNRGGASYNDAFVQPANSSGQESRFVKMESQFASPDWSHDGRKVVYTGSQKATINDLWIATVADRKAVPLLETPANEGNPAFSPDDRWIAYDSDSSRIFEVYVRSSSPGGGEVQVSRKGGWAPQWRADGKEIFFLALDGTMMAVDVTVGQDDVRPLVPHPLFQTKMLKTSNRHPYAVTGDGKRFLVQVPEANQLAVPITMALNWQSMAKKGRDD